MGNANKLDIWRAKISSHAPVTFLSIALAIAPATLFPALAAVGIHPTGRLEYLGVWVLAVIANILYLRRLRSRDPSFHQAFLMWLGGLPFAVWIGMVSPPSFLIGFPILLLVAAVILAVLRSSPQSSLVGNAFSVFATSVPLALGWLLRTFFLSPAP